MFLKYSERKSNGKTYKYYNIVEGVRVDGKVKHNILFPLGTLSDEKASQIREILKVGTTSDSSTKLYKLSDVVVAKSNDFLNIYVLHQLWCEWELDKIFRDYPYIEKLVINRCINPMSKYRAALWEDGELVDMLNLRRNGEPFGTYRELGRIDEQTEQLQSHLSTLMRDRNMLSDQAIIYDITSTYFEKTKCTLAFRGYSRDNRPDKLQIVIAMAVTSEGYPFYWKVYEGNKNDVSTVKDFSNMITKLFGVTNFVFVFDRGMVSQDNIDYIEQEGYRFISAVDRDEIKTKTPVELVQFQGVDESNHRERLQNFEKYDENLWYRVYHDAGYRYIIGFSPKKQLEERIARSARRDKLTQSIEQMNQSLSCAKRDRSKQALERELYALLKKSKIKRAVDISIEDLIIQGSKKQIQSYRVNYSFNNEALDEIALPDGLTCFYTNTTSDDFNACQVIRQYRDKNVVEEGFHEIKGLIELRPLYLSRKERVRAHVTICVLAYLLWNTLERRVAHRIKLSVADILTELAKCKMNMLTVPFSTDYHQTLTLFTQTQKEVLQHLNIPLKSVEKHFRKLMATEKPN